MTKRNSAVKKPKPSYLDGTAATIVLKGEGRGIPEPESKSVIAAIQKRFGKKLDKMSERELIRVNQALDEIFLEYLDGAKRR